MRLSTVFRNKPFLNELHYPVLGIILALLALRYPFLYLFLGFFLIFIIKRRKILIFTIILSILSILRTIQIDYTHQNLFDGNYNGIVTDIENENSYILLTNKGKIRVTSYQHNEKVGNRIEVELLITEISDKSYQEDFSYKDYLYSKGIYYTAKEINIINSNECFYFNSIKYNLLSFYKDKLSIESYQYVSALVFADNVFSDTLKDCYSMLGISHILAVSGMHIMLLYGILCYILLHLFHYYKKTIPLIIVAIYIILIGCPISALRALLFLILSTINKKSKVSYTRLDIFSISFILMIIINPYQLYYIGFILSYLVSFILIYSIDLLKAKTKLKRSYESYILIYFTTLPFVSSMNNQISILSFLLSPLLSIICGIIFIPLAYLITVIPALDILAKYIFIFFNQYVTVMANISPKINIRSFNIYFGIIYYFLWGLYLIARINNKFKFRTIISFIIFLSIYINIDYANFYTRITFIDVGQGDGALIRLKNNSGIIVVDCYKSMDYLKNMGISRIDYLILTHSDNDHIAEYKECIEYFNIGSILYSKYDKVMEDYLKDYDNIYSIKGGVKININEYELMFLGPINCYNEINSNSIVFSFNYDNHRVLFTGDMTIEEENDIIRSYSNFLESEVLKVAHHGSKTSSSDEMLNLIKPKYSIVSVGLNNNYGLPDDEVIERLRGYGEIYETRYTGNIEFSFFGNKLFIQKYR